MPESARQTLAVSSHEASSTTITPTSDPARIALATDRGNESGRLRVGMITLTLGMNFPLYRLRCRCIPAGKVENCPRSQYGSTSETRIASSGLFYSHDQRQ